MASFFLLFTLLKSIPQEMEKDKCFERPQEVLAISIDNDLNVRPLVLPSSNQVIPFIWQTCFCQTSLRKMSTVLNIIATVPEAISDKKPFCTSRHIPTI